MTSHKEQINNPQIQELLSQQQQILQRHKARVEELKDHLFFGLRFQTEQDISRATSIFTNTMIGLQCVSGGSCLYSMYRQRYLHTAILAAIMIGFGYPVQYLLKKNAYITSELDALESETSQAMKKISQEISLIIQKENKKKNKSFFAKLLGK